MMIPVIFVTLAILLPIGLSLPKVTSEKARKACKSPVSHCCVGRCRTYDFIDIPPDYRQPPEQDLNDLLSSLERTSRVQDSCVLGFMGDSLMADTRTALMCQLHSLGYVNRQPGLCRSGGSLFQEGERTPTIECSPNSILLESNVSRVCPRIALYLGSIKLVGKERLHWPKNITVIINYGVHCNDIQCMYSLLRNISIPMRRAIDELTWNLLWVETAPQHFIYNSTTRDGLYRGHVRDKEPCGPIDASLKSEANYRNTVVQKYMDSGVTPKLPIIKKFDYLFNLFQLHPTNVHDCTHYCYAPSIYGSIWAQIAALVKS